MGRSKEGGNKMVLGMAIAFLGLSVIIMAASIAHADSSSNYSNSEVYATDILGINVAWVSNDWNPIGVYSNGYFQNNMNTQLVTNTGGLWPDGGSITGSSSHENSTYLQSYVDYDLHSVFGQDLTGTLVNQVLYNTADGTYTYDIYVFGGSYYQTGTVSLPITVEVDFDV